MARNRNRRILCALVFWPLDQVQIRDWQFEVRNSGTRANTGRNTRARRKWSCAVHAIDEFVVSQVVWLLIDV